MSQKSYQLCNAIIGQKRITDQVTVEETDSDKVSPKEASLDRP